MSFKTASYFYPANCHRMNKAKIDNMMLCEYKRQIKNHLSCFMNISQIALSRPQTRKSIKQRRNTSLSSSKCFSDKKHQEKIMKTEEEEQKIIGQSLSIFKLLQNAKKLKNEDEVMKDNPFYKIQKKRLLKNKMIPKIERQTEQKLNQNEDSSQILSKLQKKIFHNQSLSKMVQSQPKARLKSETVTYYQIKNYYEQKYGRKIGTLKINTEAK